jgi:hypothetical protein
LFSSLDRGAAAPAAVSEEGRRVSDTAILDQADCPTTVQASAPRTDAAAWLARGGRTGREGTTRAWVVAAIRTRLEAALLSGIVPVLIAVGWLLRLVPALDVELAGMEEHERASTTVLPG